MLVEINPSESPICVVIFVVGSLKTAYDEQMVVGPHSASPTERGTSRRHNTSDAGLDQQFQDFAFSASVATSAKRLPAGPYVAADVAARPQEADLVYDTIDGRHKVETTQEKMAKIDSYRACIQTEMEEDERSINQTCYTDLSRAIVGLSENETEALGARLFFDRSLQAMNASAAFGLLSVIDALGTLGTEAAQKIFLQLLIQPKPISVFVDRVVLTLAQLKAPHVATVAAVEDIALDSETVAEELQTQEIKQHSTLVLGVLAGRLHAEGATDEADRIVARLEDELQRLYNLPVPADVHGRGQPHKRLETNIMEIEHHRAQAVFLDALGNAGLPRSQAVLLQHAGDVDNHLLLREAGLHGLRKYDSFEVEQALVRGALTDPHPVVRSGARVAYQFRNRSLDFEHVAGAAQAIADESREDFVYNNVSSMLYAKQSGKMADKTFVGHARPRSRRNILEKVIPKKWLDALDALDFELKLSDIDWSFSVGGKTIGSSIGLTLINYAINNQNRLESNFDMKVHDEGWFEVHAFGMMFDLFRARLCFAGHIKFDLNILKWFGIGDRTQQLLDDFGKILNVVKGKLFNGFKKLWDWITKLTGMKKKDRPHEKMKKGITEVPGAMAGADAAHGTGDQTNPTPAAVAEQAPQLTVMQLLKRAVRRASALYKNARRDVLTLYYRVFNAIKVDLPWCFKTMGRVAKLARDALTTLLKNPIQAIQYAAEAVRGFQSAVSVAKYAIKMIKKAFFWENGNVPTWLDFDYYEEVVEDLKLVMGNLRRRHTRLRRDTSSAAKQESSVLSMAIEALKKFISGDGQGGGGPFGLFTKIFDWIISPFKAVVDLIRDPYKIIKMAKAAYQEAKQIIGGIFGPKFSKRFTSGIRRCVPKCDCGTYPSTAADKYNPGVGLVATNSAADTSVPGKDIMSPVGGVVLAADPAKLTVTIAPSDSSLDTFEIILENVRPLVQRGDTVQLSAKIGVVGNNADCGANTFHLSMRKKADAEGGGQTSDFINPTQYLVLPSSPGGKWVYECDDYKVVYKGDVLKAGSFTGGKVDEQQGQLLWPPGEEYRPEFGGVMIDDPLGCPEGQWFCELEKKSTRQTIAPCTNPDGCRQRERRGEKAMELDAHDNQLTIYGNATTDSVFGAACKASAMPNYVCNQDVLRMGFAYADAPCDRAHHAQTEICLHSTCASLGHMCVDYLHSSRPFATKLLSEGVSFYTLQRLGQAADYDLPNNSTQAYHQLAGDAQVWHSMAPRTRSTTLEVRDKIVQEAKKYFVAAVGNYSGARTDVSDLALFNLGRVLHAVADSSSVAHVTRDPHTKKVQHFTTHECTKGVRHSLSMPTWKDAVGHSTAVFELFSRRAPAAEFELYMATSVLSVDGSYAQAPTGRGSPGECFAPEEEEEVAPAAGVVALGAVSSPKPSEDTTRVRRDEEDIASIVSDGAADLLLAACQDSTAASSICASPATPGFYKRWLQAHSPFQTHTKPFKKFRYAASLLLQGVYAPLHYCDTSNFGPYQPKFCPFRDAVQADLQHFSSMANFPLDKEIRCDSSGSTVIGPRAGVSLNEGLEGKELKVDETKGFKFPLFKQSLKNWEGRSNNRLVAIRSRMIDQAKRWYGEAIDALLFKAASMTDMPNYRELSQNKFKYRQFAWYALGKVAYMITAAFRSTHVARHSDGSVKMFYSAHCMDELKREEQEKKDSLASSTAYKQAQPIVVELINHFNAMWKASENDGWRLRSAQELKKGVDFIDSLFRFKVVRMRSEDGSIVAGLFPSCAPKLMRKSVEKYEDNFKPSGWEATKCFLTRAKLAALSPLKFYKANRCAIMAGVVELAGNAVVVGISMLIFSNPVTGGAAAVAMTAGKLSTKVFGKLFARWMWKGAQKVFTGLAAKKISAGAAQGIIEGWLVSKTGSIAASLTNMLARHGWNIGQGKDSLVASDQEHLACLEEYMELLVHAIFTVIMTITIDPSMAVIDLIACFTLKGLGCESDKQCLTWGVVSYKCLPKGIARVGQSNPAKEAMAAKTKSIAAKMVADFQEGKVDIDGAAVEQTDQQTTVGAAASTCYTQCQQKRLDVAKPATPSGTALRCVPNTFAPLDSDYDVQVWLKCNGMYRTGPLNGVLGTQTEAAIVAFQRCVKIPPDGLVTTSTQKAMRSTPAYKISQCATGGRRHTRARERRQADAPQGFECPENANFEFNAGTKDHQRWFVCNNFLGLSHPMDGTIDQETIDAIRTFQHHVCDTPVTGVITDATTSIMKKWFPGYKHPNCGRVKQHGTGDPPETPKYKCVKPNQQFPLNTIYEHKIFFTCNKIGQQQNLIGEAAHAIDSAYHASVTAFQKLVRLAETGEVNSETKHHMWNLGAEDAPKDKPSSQTLGQKILDKLPTRLWKFKGGWQWETVGGGEGNNPYFRADNEIVMSMTVVETKQMLLQATNPNDEGVSFIEKDDAVFQRLNDIETQLDASLKESTCALLGSPDPSRLRATALARGLDIEGTTGEVSKRLADQVTAQTETCPQLQSGIRSLSKGCCSVMPMCMGLECHVPVNFIFLSKTFKVWVRGIGVQDDNGQCLPGGAFKIEIGVALIGESFLGSKTTDFQKTITITSGKQGLEFLTFPLTKIPFLEKFDVVLRLNALETQNLGVSLLLRERATGKVTADVTVYDKIPMNVLAFCDAGRTRAPTDVEGLTLGMVDTQLIAHGLFKLTTNLAHVRARVRDVLLANFRGMLQGANVAGTEFSEPFDLCLPGRFALPTKRETFFEFTLSQFFGGIPLCLGPICIDGGLGIGGAIGADMEVRMCLFSLRGTVWIEPWAGAEGYLYAALSLGPFQAGVKLIARILETSLPTFATTVFNKWPLDICHGSDLKCIPLSARLEVFLRLRICFWKCWTINLISATLWSWSTGQISKELWRNCKNEADPSKPDFGARQISPSDSPVYQPLGALAPPVKNCRVFDFDKVCDSGAGNVPWPADNSPPLWQPKTSCWIGKTRCEDVKNDKYATAPAVAPGWGDDTAEEGTPPPPPAPKNELTGCAVKQLRDRPTDQPAFSLEINTVYPEKESNLAGVTYSVGTYKGGTDVVTNKEFIRQSTGGSQTLDFELPHWATRAVGMPLFAAVTLNSPGGAQVVECKLDSYDTTETSIDIEDVFPLSSHPAHMTFRYTVVDDSPLAQLQYAVGTSPNGDQTLPWINVQTDFKPNGTKDKNPIHFFGTPSDNKLVYFGGGRRRLARQANGTQSNNASIAAVTTTTTTTTEPDENDPGKQEAPAKVVEGVSVEECARQCVEFVDGLGCHSFDYSANLKQCRLHRVSDDHDHSVRLLPLHDFKYYPREASSNVHVEKGIVEITDLSLDHGGVYFFSMRARNNLGYVAYNSSAPMMIDLTPPETGAIRNELIDTVLADMCQASKFQRCYNPTMLNNHRFVIDGRGSAAVFNGVEGLYDMRYTRANNFLGTHFNGWVDPDSGLYKMVFGVGTEACVTDEYDYEDPHAHHYSTDDWTHQGLAHPVELKDGAHFVTVQALNTPIYGGSYVTTVCHNTPLIVDSTPPLVNSVNKVDYDDINGIIQASYDLEDPHSHVRAVRVALGRSRHDDMFLQWVSLCIGARLLPDDPRRTRFRRSCEQTYPEDPFNPVQKKLRYGLRDEEKGLPEGVYIWVRIAAVNNVDLTSVYGGTNVFLIDHTPPKAGRVMDGRFEGHDLYFESTRDGLACVNFDGFSDPESGISKYEWCIGTGVRNDKERCNAVGNQIIDVIDHIACAKVELIHQQTYYTTVWAHNKAHRVLKTMKSSDGVRIDNTAPVAGKVVDGTDLQSDIKFTDEGHNIAAVWDGFVDPESKVVDYFVSVGPAESPEAFFPRTSVHCGDGTGFYSHAKPVTCTVDKFQRHDFDLQHGHRYRVMLEAMNGAHSSTIVNTSGVVVDLTPPRLEYLGVGAKAKDKKLYFKSKTAFSANWKFSDGESGILGYEWRVYEELTPTTFRQVFPADTTAWDLLGPAETGTTAGVSFKTGRKYHADVVAKNGALRIAHFRTAGALLDLQPPVLHDITVGTKNTDESAELINGKYIELADDSDGIPAHWTATDDSSGIETYEASIKIGQTVVSKSTIKATLERDASGKSDTPKEDTANAMVTASLEKGKVYHLCVVAVDAAGWKSKEVCSHEIHVVEADVIGEALDGAIEGSDIDVQAGVSVVAVNWHSFSSAQCGIVSYEFAVGYAPFGSELRPYSDYGVQLTDKGGRAEVALPLQSGDLVFVSVRATTGCGSYLPASSDGLFVDSSRPVIEAVVAGNVAGSSATAYQADATTFSANWKAADDESPISKYTLSIGSAPGLSDIAAPWAAKGEQTTLANKKLAKELQRGKPAYLTVVATNDAGLSSVAAFSNGLVADDSRPTKGTVVCPVGVVPGDSLTCSWSGFFDAESSIVAYEVTVYAAVLTEETQLRLSKVGPNDVTYTYRPVTADAAVLDTMTQAGSSFVVSVTATNNLGATSSATQVVNIDQTAPVQGIVAIESEPVIQIPRRARREDSVKASCQVARNQISASWKGFADPESGITGYRVGVGSAPGGTQIKSLYEVGTATSILITNFDREVAPGETVYVVVEAVSGAGLRVSAVSPAISIYKADHRAKVYDGIRGTDQQWQADKTTLGAHWEFDNACPIVEYSWAIFDYEGATLQKFTKVCETIRDPVTDKEICLSGSELNVPAAANDALLLKDGHMYHVVVRATDVLGRVTFARSNGVRVDSALLVPGVVYDGKKFFQDAAVQASASFLASSWEGFGASADGLPNNRLEGYAIEFGDSSSFDDPPTEECLEYPEIDRCRDGHRGNIVPPTSIHMNSTYVKNGLAGTLVPRSVAYYATATAHSVVGSYTASSSNGIVTGYGLGIIAGRVSAPPFQIETDFIDAAFESFWTPVGSGALYYEIAIGTQVRQSTFNIENDFSVMDYTCVCIGAFRCPGHATCVNGTFEGTGQPKIVQVNGTDYIYAEGGVAVELSGLTLGKEPRYFVSVRATNGAGISNTGQSNPIIVDTTPPIEGSLTIVSPYKGDTAYVPTSGSISVEWDGWSDPESGIEEYGIALATGSNITCSESVKPDAFRDLTSNLTTYTFNGLQLVAETTYYVHLEAINRVGMATSKISIPVYYDEGKPVRGIVRSGNNLARDTPYASSRTTLAATLLQVLDAERLDCPQNAVNFVLPGYSPVFVVPKGWSHLNQIETDHRVVTKQGVRAGNSGLELPLTRSITEKNMVAGALKTDAGLFAGSQHDLSLKSGGMPGAVTSVLFMGKGWTALDDFKTHGIETNFERASSTLADIDIQTNIQSGISTVDDLNRTLGDGRKTSVGDDKPQVTVDRLDEMDNNTKTNASFGLRKGIRDSFGMQLFSLNSTEQCAKLSPEDCAAATRACRLTVTQECVRNDQVLLWSRYSEDLEEPEYLYLDLGFDAAAQFHTYSLEYTFDEPGGKPQWTLALYIDGESVAELVNVPALPTKAASDLILHRWFAMDELPENNPNTPLDPWKDTAYVASTSVNLEENPMACQPRMAWHHFNSPLRYEAAVGTTMFGVDVADFAPVNFETDAKYMAWDAAADSDQITQLNRPCINLCDNANCSVSQERAELKQVPIVVTGLDLSLGAWVDTDPEMVNFNATAGQFGFDKQQIADLKNLSMHEHYGNPLADVEDKYFQAAMYYMSVRAISGSGKVVSSTSTAILMDITPPVFTPADSVNCSSLDLSDTGAASAFNKKVCGSDPEMFDPDRRADGGFSDKLGGDLTGSLNGAMAGTIAQSSEKVRMDSTIPFLVSSEWQSSTSAVGAFWLATDEESGVKSYSWRVGTDADPEAFIPWVSVGANITAINRGLQLQHRQKVCVDVRAYNGADLYTQAPQACIKVDATAPDLSNAYVNPVDVATKQVSYTSYKNDVPVAVKYGGATDPESGLLVYKLGVGVTPFSEEAEAYSGQEVFPLSALSHNESATITIYNNKLHAKREDSTAKPEDVQQEVSMRDIVGEQLPLDFKLRLQRGARHFFTMSATNGAYTTVLKSSEPFVLLGPQENVNVIDAAGASATLALSASVDEKIKSVSVAKANQGKLAMGMLQLADLKSKYTSANPEAQFVPYIMDPATASVDTVSRALVHRATAGTYMGGSFFVTPLGNGLNCSASVTVSHDKIVGEDTQHDSYGAVFWNTVTSRWTPVSGTCGKKFSVETLGDTQIATYAYCSPNADKTPSDAIHDAVQVSLFHLIGPIRNTPPKLQPVTIETNENVPTAPVKILYTDDEKDKVKFAIDDSVEIKGGVANITEDGEFTFYPAFAHNGQVTISYTVTEYFEEELGIVPLTATNTITINIASVPSNPTLSRVFLDTKEVQASPRTYAVGYANETQEFNLLMLDFDGDEVALLHKNLPSDSTYQQASTDLALARILSESYMLAHCTKLNVSCGYPLSHMQADVLLPAAHVVTINTPMADAYSVTTVKMIAKDSTGLFSATTFELDLIACPRQTFFTPGREPICQPVSVCKTGTHEDGAPDPHRDTVCVDDTTTTKYSKNKVDIDAAQADDKSSTDNMGMIIGLTLFFLFLVCGIAACIVMQKKRQDSEKFKTGADSIMLMKDMSNKVGTTVQNEMYFANAVVSNKDNHQTGGTTNYSVPFGDQVDYSVPFDKNDIDYDNNDSFVVTPGGSNDKMYAIPVESLNNPLYFAGGTNGQSYAVPLDGEADYAQAANENEAVTYSVPVEAPRLLISMRQAEAIYGRPGQNISGVTDNKADDIYGWAQGSDASDMHDRPPWLFTSKLNRAAAEELIKSHGNRKGMFLVRVKSDDTFVVTMKSKTGSYEHQIVERDSSGTMQLNKKDLEGVTTLEGVVYTMSKDNEHVPTKLTEAICIPEIASDIGTVPWVHGSMHASNAEALLGGENGSRPGMFMVYQDAATGNRTLCVVDGERSFGHHVVTKDSEDLFCLDGKRMVNSDAGLVVDWVGFRECLAQEDNGYTYPITTALCRERCPVGRLCAGKERPSWLYDPISRKSAGHLLAGCTDGTYLIRESIESPFEFKLDHIQERKIHHNKIRFADGQWSVDERAVSSCSTLEELLEIMKDRSTSGLPFAITKPICNEDAYMIIPSLEVMEDVGKTTRIYDGVYCKARAASEGVYMDDMLLAGQNEVPMYSTAGQQSEQVVVDPSTGTVYQASTFAMGEYFSADDLESSNQAQEATYAGEQGYRDVAPDKEYMQIQDDNGGVYSTAESHTEGDQTYAPVGGNVDF